jgi:GAF domain-containing protein
MLLDEDADELVFMAVSGEGESTLIGRRFPASTGIAGWTVASRQPILVEDLDRDERFARDAAESTGYVPKTLMAAPLVHRDSVLGVLEVLDWTPRPGLELSELDMLALFAHQAAIAVDVLRGALRAQLAARDDDEYAAVARVTAALDALDGVERTRGMKLLNALEEVLTR